MTVYDEVVKPTQRMSLLEKIKLLEHISSAIKHDLELEAYKNMPREQFLDLTYGSLADAPIERNQPQQYDHRADLL